MLAIPLLGYLQFGPSRDLIEVKWAAFAVFAVAAISDLIDGKIARSRNQITSFGVIADPIADKGLIAVALIGLSWSGRLWWWVTILILVREVTVTAYRLFMVKKRVIPADQGGKVKTVVQDIAVGAMLMPLAGWWLAFSDLAMALALLLTLVTGAVFFWRALRT